MNLNGNTVLITGGSSGIGLEIAKQFLNRDNKVIICSIHFAANKAEEVKEIAWDLIVVDEAHKLGIPDKVIHSALRARELSQDKPSYQGKVIQALRNQFGGHEAKK